MEVWGSGKAVRQFVFSQDIAKVLLKILNNYNEPETLIVATDKDLTIADLAKAVAKAMDFKGSVRFDGTKPEGELRRVLSNKKFQRLFPNFRFTPLEEALRLTAQWFTANIQNLSVMKK